jgi:L-alanine-DL-glutamate epimerase-like enolase superfamily enzyme
VVATLEEDPVKIATIKAAGLRGGTSAGGWTVELDADSFAHTLVVITTEDGLRGVGSAFAPGPLVEAAVEHLAPLLVGEDALAPERVTEKLHQNTFWFGRGGTLTHAISAINIALWDLMGQACGQSVGRLIGGRYRDSVLPYASLLMKEPAALTDDLTRLVESGFQAFKIGWGPFGRVDDQTDAAIVRAARETIGDRALLAVDAGGSDAYWPQGLRWALRTSQMLADHGVAWFEEPLSPDDLDSFRSLTAQAAVPISGGETLTRRQSYQPFVENRAFDIVQPDVTKVGGINEMVRIGHAAEDHGMRMVPHGWNTAVGLAAHRLG